MGTAPKIWFSIFQDPEHPKNLIPQLLRQFYELGWVSGTGGGMSIQRGSVPNLCQYHARTDHSRMSLYWTELYELFLIKCVFYF